jgi:hypothetical protein
MCIYAMNNYIYDDAAYGWTAWIHGWSVVFLGDKESLKFTMLNLSKYQGFMQHTDSK